MSSSNSCFLIYIQISQVEDMVVWYSCLLKYFPQFVVIHTVKGFGRVKKAEVDIFLELSCFFNVPVDVSNLISGSPTFSFFLCFFFFFFGFYLAICFTFFLFFYFYCSGFCHTLKWISHGFTCVPHPDPPLPPSSPPDPSRSSQCTRSERLSHASNLGLPFLNPPWTLGVQSSHTVEACLGKFWALLY